MSDQLTRIEQKLDRLEAKIDGYSERTIKTETSVHWLKWAFTVLMSLAGTSALALSKLIK